MKILLATDGTIQSEAATEAISAFKFSDGDEIKIVSIIDMAVPMVFNPQSEIAPNALEVEQTANETAEKILETARQKIERLIGNENVAISTETLFGSPDSRIVEAAEKMHADLIIVGSHGYNRWERLLLGSISDSVVHHAPCSVLVVRTPKNL